MEALAHDVIVDVNLTIFNSVDSGVDKELGGRCQLAMHCFSFAENLVLSIPVGERATFFWKRRRV